MSMWKVAPKDKGQDHWIDFCGDEDDDGNWWYEAAVKWDGCIHLDNAGNDPFTEEMPCGHEKRRARGPADVDQYWHICDLDGFIAKLIALRDAAKEEFGKRGRSWPE